VRKSSFVIAETIPGSYDGVGRQVTSSFFHRKAPDAALPIGRYIGQPLTFKCQSIEEVRRFLAGCKAVSAQDLFGKRDYWQPPEEFERLKKGGCVDFSLWSGGSYFRWDMMHALLAGQGAVME
jgi:hypothetical protein